VTTEVKSRPIIFSGESVRAILEGRKRMTRRVVKPQPTLRRGFDLEMPGPLSTRAIPVCWDCKAHGVPNESPYPQLWLTDEAIPCPYAVGDVLWVKEAWTDRPIIGEKRVHHKADGIGTATKLFEWKSPLFMPRWASRLTLRITDVRVERLKEISHEDAIAEGCAGTNWVASSPYIIGPHADDGELPQEEFQRRWDELNARRDGGAYAWTKSPWVWVVTFKPEERT